MNIIFATMVVVVSLILVSNSSDYLATMSGQVQRQRLNQEAIEDALIASQFVRSAFDKAMAATSARGPCPSGTIERFVDNVRLCWPSENGNCFVSPTGAMRYCLASDQSAARSSPPPLLGGGSRRTRGGRNTGSSGAVPVRVMAPNCTSTSLNSSCFNCAPAAGGTCFSLVLCVGPSANAACQTGTRVLHSFGIRR